MDLVERDLGTIRDRGPFRRASLRGYIEQMSKPNDHIVFDDHVARILFEQGFSWEEDPRSIYDPEQLWNRLVDYGHEPAIRWDSCLKHGFRVARRIFGKTGNHLDAIRDDSKLISALKLQKNAGLPMLGTKEQSLVYSMNREAQIRLGIKSPNPCIAYKRTQAGNKTRLVWGYPLEMTIMEARFARPLIDRFLSKRTSMTFGLAKFELGTYIEYDIKGTGHVYALDYSRFDSSIHSSMISEVFNILGTWFSDEDKAELGWDQVVKYFTTTPIVMPDGHLYVGKRHGVPSGSYFTQLVDSIVNTALIFALARQFNCHLHWRSILVLGDDSLFTFNRKIPMRWIAVKLQSYGIKMNVSKSKYDTLHYLGATWLKTHPDGDVRELATKAVHPESFRKYSRNSSRYHQAVSVLRSYASCYLSAWNFVPRHHHSLMWMDDVGGEDVTGFGLSGSDRFHSEYELWGHMGGGLRSVGLRLLL